MSTLEIAWFFIVGILLVGYAILDGFDLGVGFWHLFVRKDGERRALLAAIEPLWDGNEVWLITLGGALFAAFPLVYATVFSGLYLALMLVLFGLIFRAVAIGFRNESTSTSWRFTLDVAFSFGSILVAVLFGVALGNIVRGLPLDESGNFTGTFLSLLNPYALLIGALGLVMIATHGALYLSMKTEHSLSIRATGWAQKAWYAYASMLLIVYAVTVVTQPQLLENYRSVLALWIFPALTLAAVLMIGVFTRRGESARAFAASSVSIASLIATVGAAIFPKLVPALNASERSLTVSNASSSPLTLGLMLAVTLVGMPVVLMYTAWVYRTFRGKVEAEPGGY